MIFIPHETIRFMTCSMEAIVTGMEQSHVLRGTLWYVFSFVYPWNRWASQLRNSIASNSASASFCCNITTHVCRKRGGHAFNEASLSHCYKRKRGSLPQFVKRLCTTLWLEAPLIEERKRQYTVPFSLCVLKFGKICLYNQNSNLAFKLVYNVP